MSKIIKDELVGKTVVFTLFDSHKHYGKISRYLGEYNTYLIEEPRNMLTGQRFDCNTQIELELEEIEKILEIPMYFYVSKEICIFNPSLIAKRDGDFPIRFSEFANNDELLRFTPFVGTQIHEDNTSWFAGYLLAFEVYDDAAENTTVKNLLKSNCLVSIAISDKYEFKKEFKEVYDKIDQSKKE